MTGNIISTKPQKKFCIGGILCIICGLVFGLLAIIGISSNILSEFIRLLKSVHNPSLGGLLNIIWTGGYIVNFFSALIGCAIELIGALSFLFFGVLLLMKKNIRLLAILPLVQMLILGYKILVTGTAGFEGLIVRIASISSLFDNGENFVRIFFEIFSVAFETGAVSILTMLLAMLGYFLLLVVILGNCRDMRVDNTSGKLRFWAVVSVLAIGGASAANILIEIFEFILYFLVGRVVFASLLVTIVNSLEQGFIALLLTVTVSFVVAWLIKPFKKLKKSE